MSWTVRNGVWALMAAACVAGAWLALTAPANQTTRPSVPAVRPAPAPGLAPTPAPREPVERDPLLEALADPFKAVSFSPPPQPAAAVPVAAPAPPPAPVAPAFPYRYFGRMRGVDGAEQTYLTRGNAIVPIHLHQILDQDYRIDKLSDTELVIKYLPLDENTRIVLTSGEN